MERKLAVITGSGRERVGNVVAHSLAKAGFDIAVHYNRSAEEANETVEQLQNHGIAADAFQADVGDEKSVDTMFGEILQRWDRIDAMVNTASIWNTISFEQTTADDLLASFRVNTMGTFLCSRRAGLQMTKQDSGGSIVTIGDWAIDRPYLDHAAYFIAKGSIPTMTRMLAVELAHRNPRVRVNCIHPGPVMFPPESTEEEKQKMIESTLVKNGDCPESIALAVKYLIDNEFVTGSCLHVDGGRAIFTPVQFKEKSI